MRDAVLDIPEELCKNSPRAFSRDGKLTPEFLITFLLAMVADSNRCGVTHVLARFWESAHAAGIPLPQPDPVSASAVTQARAKLPGSVMREVLWRLIDHFPDGCAARRSPTWRGRRVFAIDGQKLNANRSDELRSTFGVPTGCYCPQLLFSVLVDCCARMPVDYEIDSHRVEEREHMRRMLESLPPGAILVLDRGYPSHEILADLVARKIDFVIRVPMSSTFSAVDEFVASRAKDERVTNGRQTSQGFEETAGRVRLVRFGRKGNETVCVTSLPKQDFSLSAVEQLYHMRWQSEECFKAMSDQVLSQGLFRSETANGVRQELGAVVLYYAISRVLAGAATEHLDDPSAYVQQKAAIMAVANVLAAVILGCDAERSIEAIERNLRALRRRPYRERPNRAHHRRSYTPGPKWGAHGRRGA